MAESHTKGERRHRPVTTAPSGSAMARAGDARPYVAGERAAFREPPEVAAARERHRALNAERDAARAALDAQLEALAGAAREARERDG